jgi:hypothetical protein
MQDRTIGFVIVGKGSKSGLACIARGARVRYPGYNWAWHVLWLNAAFPPTSIQKSWYENWKRQTG